jgi:hypothetical protein
MLLKAVDTMVSISPFFFADNQPFKIIPTQRAACQKLDPPFKISLIFFKKYLAVFDSRILIFFQLYSANSTNSLPNSLKNSSNFIIAFSPIS